jgi:hypothetical protein
LGYGPTLEPDAKFLDNRGADLLLSGRRDIGSYCKSREQDW